MTNSNAQPCSSRLIELRLWRQFVAVGEELHFSRAATRLNMTQPPLTQAIAQLEALLAVRLFDRTRRSVALTSAGVALLPQARDLLNRAQALPMQARAAAAGEVGRLRLAFVSTVGYSLLPRWVQGFRARFPAVTLELVEATGDVQLQQLERGEIDAGFMLHSPGFEPPGLSNLRVASEPLVVAVPDAHRLATAQPLVLAEVLAEPLIIFPRRIVPSLFDAIFGMYHAVDRSPFIAQEAIQMQTIVNLVSAGLGIAWVPESVRQFQRSGVVYREVGMKKLGKSGEVEKAGKASMGINAATMPGCETSLVWSSEALSPTLARFLEFASEARRP